MDKLRPFFFTELTNYSGLFLIVFSVMSILLRWEVPAISQVLGKYVDCAHRNHVQRKQYLNVDLGFTVQVKM